MLNLNLREALGQISPLSFHEWVWITASWYIGGSAMFLLEAKFGYQGWNESYYLWDCITDLLAFVTICVASREIIKTIYPVALYAGVRLWTEIQVTIWKWQDINTAMTVDILSLLATMVTIHLLTKDLIERWFRSH